MRMIQIALWASIACLTALWVAANLSLSTTFTTAAICNPLLQYTGVISIGAMSIAMILATRATWLDAWLNGLDKSYRLHKWLGIVALISAMIHWLTVNGPKWVIELGLMDRPERGAPPAVSTELGTVQTFLNTQRGSAEMLGEWAFYAVILLIALALIKRFPYKYFASTHTVIAVAYIVLVFHSVVLLDFDAWIQPLGIVVAILMIGGVVSGAMALTWQIGRRRQVRGTIEGVKTFSEMRVTEALIKLDEGWKGHDAGQFAFVTFDQNEGKHPFTIASAWDSATNEITFIIKALGDYTTFLPEHLAVGSWPPWKAPMAVLHLTTQNSGKSGSVQVSASRLSLPA